MNPSRPLPLVVITGFLGSGKTTLLKAWAPLNPVPREKTALVINDFGPVNIDAGMLEELKFSLRSIAGGCVCCQTFSDLIGELQALAAEPRWEWAWLETSGLAEPEEVLDHLTDPALRGRIAIHRLVHVVDAANFPARWRHRAVEEEQLRFADTLVLTKTDKVPPARVAEIRSRLAAVNPAAMIVESACGQADPSFLWTPRTKPAPSPSRSSVHDHHHHHHHHDHDEEDSGHQAAGPGAVTLFLPFRQPVGRRQFEDFLQALPPSVYRAKGFIRFAEEPGALWTFQRVGAHEESLLLPFAKDGGGSESQGGEAAPETGVVVIGPQLDEAALWQAHRGLFA